MLMKPCERCGGKGVTARQRRLLDNGLPDPSDIIGATNGLCDACAGSGEVRVNPETIAERTGYAADLM